MGTDSTLKTTLSLGRGRVTADGNKTGVDVSKFEGRGVIVFDVEFVSGTSTYDATVQHSEDDGSTDPYAALNGPDGVAIAITQVGVASSLQQKPVDWSACKKFVRIVDNVGAAGTPVYNPVILAQGYKQSSSS
jgi:hypothetical protein